MADRLPLFPLGQPLFPGVLLNLQIFEQRYLRLIRESLKQDSAFGIVAIAEGNDVGEQPDLYSVGLEVKIVDWRQQKNGLLGVSVLGARRFEILNTQVEEDGLLIGGISWLTESTSFTAIPEENLESLEALLRELIAHESLAWVEVDDAVLSAEELSWKLAQVLPISLEQKIPLLMESESSTRLAMIQAQVDELSGL